MNKNVETITVLYIGCITVRCLPTNEKLNCDDNVITQTSERRLSEAKKLHHYNNIRIRRYYTVIRNNRTVKRSNNKYD